MYIKNFIAIVWLFLEIKIPKFLCKGPASNGNANGIAMDRPLDGKPYSWEFLQRKASKILIGRVL
jgi:hypothetical protein